MSTPATSDSPAKNSADDAAVPTRAARRRGRSRTLPVSFGALAGAARTVSRPTAVKGLVGLGLASSLAAAIAIPVQASPEQVELASGSTAALVARDRAAAADGTTSRSTGRAAVTERVAVTAPAAPKGATVDAGVGGVAAVAKPKPKPTPTPEKTTEERESTTERQSSSTDESSRTQSRSSSSESSSSSSSSGGSGVSMAYYGWCNDKGLGSNASKVCSAVRSNFGITNIGGFRAGAGDHGTGKAVDIMISSSSQGDAVARWAIANMGAYNMTYVIWQQRIWLAGADGWRSMEDRGSPTQNHMDHVHVSVE